MMVVKELVKGFEVLKNTERFKIVKVLYNKGPLFFSQIRAEIGCSPSKLSYHLKVLEEVKIISNQRKLVRRGKLFSSTYGLTDYGRRLFRFLSSLSEKKKTVISRR